MKKFLLLFLILFSSVPLAIASDETVKNAGFVQTNIWYSKESFYAGDAIRIYTAIFNGTSNDLSGKVEFLSDGVLIGKTQFDLLSSGQVRDVSVAWKATEGSHTMTARIVDASISLRGGKRTSIILENAEAGKVDLQVEINPAVKEALAKADTERVASTSAQAVGVVANVLQTVNNSIPLPIKEGTTASVSAIESLRTALGSQLRVAKENRAIEIDKLNTSAASSTSSSSKPKPASGILSTVAQGSVKPFAYVLYGIFAFMQYFFEWRIVFYGVLFYALYRLLKWGIIKIRNR